MFFIFYLWSIIMCISGQSNNWITVAACRATCVQKFIKFPASDAECAAKNDCFVCFELCNRLVHQEEDWKYLCDYQQPTDVCTPGCQIACEAVFTFPQPEKSSSPLTFPPTPSIRANITNLQLTYAHPWGPQGWDSERAVVFMLFWRNEKLGKWQYLVTTLNYEINVSGPHGTYIFLEFKLLAVAADGIVAEFMPKYSSPSIRTEAISTTSSSSSISTLKISTVTSWNTTSTTLQQETDLVFTTETITNFSANSKIVYSENETNSYEKLYIILVGVCGLFAILFLSTMLFMFKSNRNLKQQIITDSATVQNRSEPAQREYMYVNEQLTVEPQVGLIVEFDGHNYRTSLYKKCPSCEVFEPNLKSNWSLHQRETAMISSTDCLRHNQELDNFWMPSYQNHNLKNIVNFQPANSVDDMRLSSSTTSSSYASLGDGFAHHHKTSTPKLAKSETYNLIAENTAVTNLANINSMCQRQSINFPQHLFVEQCTPAVYDCMAKPEQEIVELNIHLPDIVEQDTKKSLCVSHSASNSDNGTESVINMEQSDCSVNVYSNEKYCFQSTHELASSTSTTE